MIKFLLAIAVGFTVFALIVSCSPQSIPTNRVQAGSDMPYQMTSQQTGIDGISRYENQEAVCYVSDQYRNGGISCMSKLGSNLH